MLAPHAHPYPRLEGVLTLQAQPAVLGFVASIVSGEVTDRTDVLRAREKPWLPSEAVLKDVQDVVFELRLSQDARAYIDACIAHGPSRQPQDLLGNVRTEFTSRTGSQMMLESRTGELPKAVQLDSDPDVIWYLAQPPKVRLEVKTAEGRIQGTPSYTPDFLVVRRNEIAIEECRPLARLARSALKNSFQWYVDATGNWRYRAAEDAFTGLGFRYGISANEQMPTTFLENIRFLEDYYSDRCPRLTEARKRAISQFFATRHHISFIAAIHEGGFTADELNKAIVEQVCYVDLTKDRVADTHNLVLCSSAATRKGFGMLLAVQKEEPFEIPGTLYLKPGSSLVFEGNSYQVVLPGQRDVILQAQDGSTRVLSLKAISDLRQLKLIEGDAFIDDGTTSKRRYEDCSTEQITRAMGRLDALLDPSQTAFASKTLSAFRAKTRGLTSPLDQLLALTDDLHKRGNRTPQISDENWAVAEEAKKKYNTPTCPTKKATYLDYVGRLENKKESNGQPMKPMSYVWFAKFLDARVDIRSRKGKRHAYQEAHLAYYLDNSSPVEGVRPDEICYIDHTCLNLSTQTPQGLQLHKPWLTIARDGNTTNVRGLYISYDEPSVLSVLMVIRDMVRRNGRLPKILVVDNGKEFHSKCLKLVAKLLRMDIRFRPTSQPRYAAQIESLIGATEIEILAQAEGNTRLMKDARMTTKSVDPFRRTTWTLPATYFAFEHYCFVVRPNRPNTVFGIPSAEYEKKRWAETGMREHLLFTLDRNFMLLTAPHARRIMHVVDRSRGVWVDGAWYNNPQFAALKKGAKCEVRIEPWLFNVVYVRLERGWVAATSSVSRWLSTRTRREAEIEKRQAKKVAKVLARAAGLSAQAAQQMRILWDPRALDPRLKRAYNRRRGQQDEMLELYSKLGLTNAMPVDGGLQRVPGDGDVMPHRLDDDVEQNVPTAASPTHYVAEVPSDDADSQSSAGAEPQEIRPRRRLPGYR